MRNKFLISIAITIILPAILIGFFAGINVLVNFLVWFFVASVFLVTIGYFVGSSGKNILLKLTTFETGLWLTSLFIRIIGLFLSFTILSSVLVLYFAFREVFLKNYGKLYLIAAILIALSLMIILVSLFFWLANQISKQTKLGYFLGLITAVYFIPLILGIFPVWFFLRYRLEYFLKNKFDISG